MKSLWFFLILTWITGCKPDIVKSQQTSGISSLDEKVKKFLDNHADQWYDMNIPVSDGKVLYDIIVKNNYKTALEIGTSTGHSAIWIAWALTKTGGKLITIEVDKARHREALVNFEEAGVMDYIEARLADAHQLVPQLKGPFDFVFNDADKDWYINYFMTVSPKLKVGGCFTAHNVQETRGYGYGGQRGTVGFYNYVKSLSNYETTVINSGGGISVSYKKSE